MSKAMNLQPWRAWGVLSLVPCPGGASMDQGSLECSVVEDINTRQSRESNRSLLFQLEEAY